MLKNPVVDVYCPQLKKAKEQPRFVFVVKRGTMQQILDKRSKVQS
jgi:hypothetical protein